MATTKSRDSRDVATLGRAIATQVRRGPAGRGKEKRPLSKPVLPTGEVLKFAEGRSKTKVIATSGLIPEGDVRLTANIRADLHLKLKIRAAQERTTVGELVERWIESWK